MAGLAIYRGPLERSRVAFLLEVLRKLEPSYTFVWVYPGVLTKEQRSNFAKFIHPLGPERVVILEGGKRRLAATLIRLNKVLRDGYTTLFAIGFSAKYLLPPWHAARAVWCVNGVPEEGDMSSLRGVRRARLKWLLTKFGSVQSAVVVSSRMERLLARNHPGVPVLVAPTCVDTSNFTSASEGRRPRAFCYLGTGAVWQALDLTSSVWREIHRIDPQVTFRVISRDPRARQLGDGIDPDRIEFVSSEDFEQVAAYLRDCEAGFLLRRPVVVNQVSYPTKLGEYLASGLWVVTTAIDWDIEDFVAEQSCGLALAPDLNPTEMAHRVLDFRREVTAGTIQLDLVGAAMHLDRGRWVEQAAAALRGSPSRHHEGEA